MKNILTDQSSSLINSRNRLYCQFSEDQSRTFQDNQKAIIQFRRQIESRYKISVSNKLYTFPRFISHVSDLISSDQESSQSTQKKNHNQSQERVYDFKRKQQKDSRNRISTQMHTHQLKNNTKALCKISTKTAKNNKSNKQIFKNERLRTQPDCPNSFIELVKQKIKK